MEEQNLKMDPAESVEKDLSLQRTITMPLLLYKLCKKYGVSVSDATREGAIMLLRQNDRFMDCDENIEEIYKAANSKYKDKIITFVNTITKLTTGK